MRNKPTIQPALSSFDKTLELAAFILLLVLWGFSCYAFLTLPFTVPVHFNITGEVDKYGNKRILLILPALVTGIYIVLSLLIRYAHVFFNYHIAITETYARRQYKGVTRMLRFLKLSVMIVFSLAILFTYLTGKGAMRGLGSWFFPFVLALFFVPVIVYIGQILKDK